MLNDKSAPGTYFGAITGNSSITTSLRKSRRRSAQNPTESVATLLPNNRAF